MDHIWYVGLDAYISDDQAIRVVGGEDPLSLPPILQSPVVIECGSCGQELSHELIGKECPGEFFDDRERLEVTHGP